MAAFATFILVAEPAIKFSVGCYLQIPIQVCLTATVSLSAVPPVAELFVFLLWPWTFIYDLDPEWDPGPSFLTFFFPYTFLLTYLLPYSFNFWLIYFFHFQNRPVPFPGRRSLEATKPALVFGFIYSIFCYGCMFAFVLFIFSTKPRDWLGRMYLKWPILCRVGRNTLTQLINQLILTPNK